MIVQKSFKRMLLGQQHPFLNKFLITKLYISIYYIHELIDNTPFANVCTKQILGSQKVPIYYCEVQNQS